ncbi:MAG: class I SAM-dependent methyltransferase [Candidatus Yanofskybacteria bacterium]|nr:class I SAM-dependent methyltransferase [Candidatus Yanofskybacteria bacterium]
MEPIHYKTLYETEERHWWYEVRRKIVLDLVRHYTYPDSNILDVGCGTGELLKELEPLGHIQGVDTSPEAVEFCHKRGLENVHVASLPNLPFPSDSFNTILCLDVLEHIQDDNAALEELHRILKPNGILICAVPAFQILWGKTDELSHHFRRYRLGQLAKKITSHKFEVMRKTYFNTLLFPPILFTRLLVRLLRISVDSENTMTQGWTNSLLKGVFGFEATLLKFMNFPFGVSALAIAKKSK